MPVGHETYVASAEDIVARCDSNTIGVVAVLGSTYTGHFDDVAALDAAIGAFNAANGTDIGIHVDGASGGFVAPFLYPDLKWDFALKNVVSINLSGECVCVGCVDYVRGTSPPQPTPSPTPSPPQPRAQVWADAGGHRLADLPLPRAPA